MDLMLLAVLGLGASAAYALLSVGLVLIYRASGVLNFAHGAMAMVGAYLYYELTENGGWPAIPAAVISVVTVGLLGAVVYQGIMRPLRDASVVVRIIATLALMTVLQSVATLRYEATTLSVQNPLPQDSIHLFGLDVPQDRLWLIGIAAVLTIAMQLVATRTTFGLATRGVAENQRTAAAVGWSPHLVATINWAIGAGLAALAGILIAPLSSLSVNSLTLLVVPALAVALLGGFSSFSLAFLGAVVLGVAQGVTTVVQAQIPGLADGLPFVLILIAIVVRRANALPTRGESGVQLPSLGTGKIRPWVIVALFVVGVVGTFLVPEEWAIALGISVVVGVMMLSIVVVTGYAGQLSLGQYAIAGMSALLAAVVVINGLPFELAMLAGVALAAVVGLVFGLPSLRMRGATLAIVTLGMGAAIQALVFANGDLTGGAFGYDVSGQTFFGIDIDPIMHARTYTIFCLCWFALTALAVRNLRRGDVGRRLVAVRANERAAASLGVNVPAAKLYAFVVSACLAGLAGILLAFSSSSVLVGQGFESLASISAVLSAVVGGVGHVTGAVFGGQLAPGGLPAGVIANHVGGGSGPQWLVLIGGVLVLVTVLLNPNGIAGGLATAGKRKRVAEQGGEREVVAKAPPQPGPEEPVDQQDARGDGVLSTVDLSVDFGGVHALRNVSLTVRAGEVVGLIGPNGAGKTTFIDAITGYVKASGTVQLDGKPVSALPPHRRARAGITRSFQSLELFDDVTVEENLRTAVDDQNWVEYARGPFARRRTVMPPSVQAVIAEFELADVLDELPRNLSYGKRRLVAIARAVAMSPRFLLLDEPAAGLGSAESMELSAVVLSLAKRWNIGVLLVEHDVDMVMKTCDRVMVLQFGEKLAEGTPEEVQQSPEVIEAYLGHTAHAEAEPARNETLTHRVQS